MTYKTVMPKVQVGAATNDESRILLKTRDHALRSDVTSIAMTAAARAASTTSPVSAR